MFRKRMAWLALTAAVPPTTTPGIAAPNSSLMASDCGVPIPVTRS